MTTAMTKVRFAPSPTGYLHIGNVRTALINWLFVRKAGGQFLLRIDDTDPERSKDEYTVAIMEDLQWIGMEWDELEHQRNRLERYEEAKQRLIRQERLYPCYETEQELEVRRKMQLGRGLPPIYDRAALKLTDEDKAKFETEGRTPHWRFLLNEDTTSWADMVRGPQSFEGRHMSDPILLRADGSPTYMLPSCVDDIDMGITHVIRGEDHVSNTAIQIQLIEALGGKAPDFGHVSLIRTKEGELSKRKGGNDIRTLRAEGIEPMALTSMLARLGTSEPIEPRADMQELAQHFDIQHFGRAPAHYDVQELERINHRIVSQYAYAEVQERLAGLGVNGPEAEPFWDTVRPNLTRLSDVKDWWRLCNEAVAPQVDADDSDFVRKAADLLPEGDWDGDTWNAWLTRLKQETDRKGKTLFMPIRKALTGMEHGPELKDMLPLIGREKAVKRLQGEAA